MRPDPEMFLFLELVFMEVHFRQRTAKMCIKTSRDKVVVEVDLLFSATVKARVRVDYSFDRAMSKQKNCTPTHVHIHARTHTFLKKNRFPFKQTQNKRKYEKSPKACRATMLMHALN